MLITSSRNEFKLSKKNSLTDNAVGFQPPCSGTRELKIETFSGRRRPDWQSKPGTEKAVASLQNSNIKIAVNSGGRRRGRLPKRKI